MIIKKVVLENFRQFSGVNTVELSDGTAGKICLVYGTNGGGKTTLLSAMYWCLQGTAPYIANPRQLATRHLFDQLGEGSELDISVMIEIEDGGETFHIKRKRTVRKDMGAEVNSAADKLSFTTQSGEPVGNPQFEVNSRFPERFAKFFFVPGEKIDKFFDGNSMEKLIEDIKSISDIGSYETAIKLASKVEEKLLKEISDSAGDAAIATQRDAISSIQEVLKEKHQKLTELLSEQNNLKAEISRISSYLGDTNNFDALMLRIDSLQGEIGSLDSQKLICEANINELLKRQGYLAFTESLDLHLTEGLKTLGIKEKYESLVSKELLIQLSNSEKCLCGNPIHEAERDRLTEKSKDPIYAQVAAGGSRDYKPLPIELGFDSYKSRVTTELERFTDLSRIILELKAKLHNELNAGSDDDEKLEKFKMLQVLKISLTGLNADVLEIQSAISEFEEKRDSAENKLKKLIEAGSIQEKMQSDRDSIARIKAVLKQELSQYEVEFMTELNSELDKLIEEFVFEPVAVRFREGFNFDLVYKSTGELFGEAGGQEKAKAIAMIIALHRLAARRANSGSGVGNSALKSFPLIIDSPFGELGLEMKRRVADELLRETSQCILLLSDSQAPGAVDSLDEELISSENLLHSYSTGSGSESISKVRNRNLTWLTFNEAVARSEIERIL